MSISTNFFFIILSVSVKKNDCIQNLINLITYNIFK